MNGNAPAFSSQAGKPLKAPPARPSSGQWQPAHGHSACGPDYDKLADDNLEARNGPQHASSAVLGEKDWEVQSSPLGCPFNDNAFLGISKDEGQEVSLPTSCLLAGTIFNMLKLALCCENYESPFSLSRYYKVRETHNFCKQWLCLYGALPAKNYQFTRMPM